MKEQIKRRMEVLLQSEVQARSISRSTTTRTAGQTSLTGSSLREERERAREETKADLMFNMDTGKGGRRGEGEGGEEGGREGGGGKEGESEGGREREGEERREREERKGGRRRRESEGGRGRRVELK